MQIQSVRYGSKKKAAQLAVYLGVKVVEGEASGAAEKAATKKNLDITTTFMRDLFYGQPTRENKVSKPTYTSSSGFALNQAHQTQHTAQ